MRCTSRLLVVAVTVLTASTLGGCACGGPMVEVIDTQTDTFSFPIDSARSAVIELDLGIGELTIEDGSTALCSGEAQYNIAEWKPVVEHSVDGGEALVRITQPSLGHRTIGKKARSHWTLEVSDDVPTHLVIDMGVGESRVNLGAAMIEQLDIDAGVGEVVIDAAHVRHDLTIDIDSGVGSITIHVPDDVGVHVDCDRGIGSFNYTGLTKTGGAYVNAAYGETESLITIRIDSGVGEISIVAGTMTASI
jgi:hypothetical protein